MVPDQRKISIKQLIKEYCKDEIQINVEKIVEEMVNFVRSKAQDMAGKRVRGINIYNIAFIFEDGLKRAIPSKDAEFCVSVGKTYLSVIQTMFLQRMRQEGLAVEVFYECWGLKVVIYLSAILVE